MKPPIFSAPPTGTTAQQFMHRARMFRAATIRMPDYTSNEPNWPKYALLTHAIELVLKAFADHSGHDPNDPGKRASNHDLRGWYQLALSYGLPDSAAIAEHIEVLHELHSTHYTRYPQRRATPVPGADNIADATVDHLLELCSRAINLR